MESGEFMEGLEDVSTGFIRGETFNFRPVQYYAVNDLAIFEGDIVLGSVQQVEQQTAALLEEVDQLGAVALTAPQYRWPDATIPFTIDPQLSDVARVEEAIAHWNEKTNVWLKPRDGEADYVTFRPGDGCASPIGRQGGQQFIWLAAGCDAGRVMHEIGHTACLWHEQSREDRDLHIRILWQNIRPSALHNFNQHITDGDDIGPYDYGSIMHYPGVAFSRNGEATIVTRGNQEIGQRAALSAGDIDAINSLYPSCAPGKP